MKILAYINRPSVFLLACAAYLPVAAAPVEISSGNFSAITIEPVRESGLNDIFVVNESGTVSVSYTATSASSSPKWYRYSSLGGGHAEEIQGVSYDGNVSSVSNAETDMGYIIEDNDNRYYFWIVGYGRHQFSVNSVTVSEESGCNQTILDIDGSGEEIHYYGINGRRFTLSREIEVSFLNLEWDDEQSDFIQTEQIKTIESIDHQVFLTPPAYCNTVFTVSGDRFMKEWGIGKTISSQPYVPVAVDCRTIAEQVSSGDTENSNQISGGTEGLGGSAPAEINFTAFITDAVIHTEWQMSRDGNFQNIDYRISGQDLNFVFRDEGTIYARFVGSNSDGSCETYGETYTVNIGASELKCPNAFSPGASEGVNDEWKVSYRSIIEFECWIFDRYGTQLYHFSDPEGGWDGKYRGKIVSPGVYYYVIKAKGADGKEYKRSGDINIIRSKGRKGTSGGGGAVPTE